MDSHWLICLSFCLTHTVLPGSGGDPFGMLRKDARVEGSSSSPVVSRLLHGGVNHVVLVFAMQVLQLGLAVQACAWRGTHEGLRRVRVLHKECRSRRRDVLVGDVRGGT